MADPIILGIAGAQTAIGLAQRNAAKKRRKRSLAQFDYDIPSATEEQVRLSREYASRSGLPGEDITRARLESDLAGSVSQAEGAASTAEEVLGLYGKMFGQKSDINRQILESGAKYKSEQEMNLAKSLGLLAQAEEQQFYYNKYVPFMSEMGYATDQATGGAANIASGLQTAYSAWENEWMMDAWKDIYGGESASVTGAPSESGLMTNNKKAFLNELWNGSVPMPASREWNPAQYGQDYPAY